jgi:hypothetical protein
MPTDGGTGTGNFFRVLGMGMPLAPSGANIYRGFGLVIISFTLVIIITIIITTTIAATLN